MKSFTFFILCIIFSVFISCRPNTDIVNNKQMSSKENNTSYDELTNDLTTLDGFWSVFQEAVANQDVKTIESLYKEGIPKLKFNDDEYKKHIAEGKVTDFKKTDNGIDGKLTYEFMMTFEPDEEGKAEGQEESATVIYIQKNEKGKFEIVNVLEAG